MLASHERCSWETPAPSSGAEAPAFAVRRYGAKTPGAERAFLLVLYYLILILYLYLGVRDVCEHTVRVRPIRERFANALRTQFPWIFQNLMRHPLSGFLGVVSVLHRLPIAFQGPGSGPANRPERHRTLRNAPNVR